MCLSNVDSRHAHLWAVLILLAGLVATWFAYAPGLGGQLHFDDYHNLKGLAKITNAESALNFVISGTAGPLGRPLALASFLPEAHAWPDTPSVFLRTNIAIHLLNGLLVAWFLYLLGRAQYIDEGPAAITAAAAASIWMMMPLLASSSLFIVQRMTTLSAAFALLGAVGYMYARLSIRHRPINALIGMTFLLGLGALLAVFTKENGALIFLFVLAAEATLLKRPERISPAIWRSWFTLVLLVPLAVLTIFLIYAFPYSEAIVLRRGFTGLERFATQAEILWKYLYLAFIPSVDGLGPYHDDYRVSRDMLDPVTLLSILGWLAVISAAIRFRNKSPLFAFAVAWYLLGHVLESTWLNLELYFEHRNYLPLVGPAYAAVAYFVSVPKRWRKLVVIGAVAYASLLGAVLISTTTLWGAPALAAEMWHIYKPASTRAVQNLANNLEKQGDHFASRRVLSRFRAQNPNTEALEIQILALSCVLEPDAEHNEAIVTTEKALRLTDSPQTVANTFGHIYELVRNETCPTITNVDLYDLGTAILSNQKFTANISRHNIHIILARIGIDRKDFSLAMRHMEAALELHQDPKTLALAIGILNSGGRFDISRQFLQEAKKWSPPNNPLVARKWRAELKKLEVVLNNFASPPTPLSVENGISDVVRYP